MPRDNIGAIDAILRDRAELRILAEGVVFSVGAVFDAPFRVRTGTLIEMSPAAVRSGAALVIHIRHALEIAMWHRIVPAPRPMATELAASALACWTTLQYIDLLPSSAQAETLDLLPSWLQHLYRSTQRIEGTVDRLAMATELVTAASRLLPLQGTTIRRAAIDEHTMGHAVESTAEFLVAASPTEGLLTHGGDSRVTLDAASRLNKYGCSPVPRPSTVALSSCTASSPSESSYRAAENARQQLLRGVGAGVSMSEAFAKLIDEARRDVGVSIGVDRIDGAEIVLAASGTDCEFYALQLALQRHSGRLVSILIGAEEIGGGSPAAANGRHFDAVAPLARPVPAGRPVEGLDVERLRVESVPLRDSDGFPVPIGDIDRAVERLAREVVADGGHVLLHLVDGSKTGLRAPSVRSVRRLHQELGPALTVVVDAAQMRTRPETLAEYVEAGWLVMISGSKFFAGPPFSGALLVPPDLVRYAEESTSIPAGLSAYTTAFDVPAAWRRWKAALPVAPNVGVLVRWRAALSEMQAFRAIDDDVKNQRIAALCRDIQSEVVGRRNLQLVPSPVGDRDDIATAWDACPTIFTFVLKREAAPVDQHSVLDYDEAWQVYVWLNRDLSAMLPSHATAFERTLASRRCHIGQPVRLKWSESQVAGALRIALSARSITENWLDARCVLDKIEVILRYWPALTARPAVA